MLQKIIFVLVILLPILSVAQTGTISGILRDNLTNEPVVGGNVFISKTARAITDLDGKYEIKDVPYGDYKMVISVISFDTIRLDISVNTANVTQDIGIGESQELKEIQVIGNISTGQKSPIAVTKISSQKILEELAGRDIPMLLNSTPGVYATQTGGGDGDARITVRGFDQRNVGVLIDGVPVNDMENGAVYWSNWFGLDAITQTIQIQRGLGATKLALPSVGGTLNIITQGIGSRKGLSFRQELSSGNLSRTTLAYNSGVTKKGFGILVSGSYKKGQGWVDGTPSEGGFYYGKIFQKYKKHLISLSAFGAPQNHGQRSFSQPIQFWNSQRALDEGAELDSSLQMDRGYTFNEHYGYTTRNGKREILNERLNYYHKPQITLKDFWSVNKKLSISNLAYISIGRGGGTRLSNYGAAQREEDGTIAWDKIIYSNQYTNIFGTVTPNIDTQYDSTMLKSNQVLTSAVNNHFWIGYLGQFTYEKSKEWSFSGGLDYRNYKGTHYREIRDLLGGDYFVNAGDKNNPSPVKKKGDKIADPARPFENHRDGLVQWVGLFGQAEYTGTRWTSFFNLSGVENGYKGIDYFQKKVLEVEDTTLRIGAKDTITYQGNTYTASSEGLEYFQTKWKWVPGFTVKLGGNYLLTEESNVFINVGYLSRTPSFSNVVDNNTNTFFKEIKNEIIQAIEGGYSFANNKFGINVNGYITNWKNKPIPFGVAIPDPLDPTSTIRLNINGMDALHIGAEVDLAYQITKRLSTEIMLSYGDWTWQSTESVYIPEIDDTISFDAKGVHVGDAAQSVYSASVRYEPFKKFYVKVQYMFFDRYYASFDPFSLSGEKGGHESYKVPGYGNLNLFAGYRYDFNKKYALNFSGSIQNVLNTIAIADARDNFQQPMNFDAQSAAVLFGQGLRFNVSVGLQF